MDSTKYIGMDVHKEATTIAVMNSAGRLVMESIVETKAATLVQFFEGLRGDLSVTFEEGTWAAWLYDLLKPHVTKVVVCNPRKNALLKTGNKSDRIDARKLAELLRAGLLSAVYHGETGLRTLKELCRSYLAISKDLACTMNRVQALYRSWSIPCGVEQDHGTGRSAPGRVVLSATGWAAEVTPGSTVRSIGGEPQAWRDGAAPPDSLYRSDSGCSADRADANAASVSHQKTTVVVQRGLALETHSSGEYHYAQGRLQRSRRPVALRGLNQNHNHDLKSIFKGAATKAGSATGPFHDFYSALLAKGMKPTMARLTLARKIAAITLLVWKKGVCFDAQQLKRQVSV